MKISRSMCVRTFSLTLAAVLAASVSLAANNPSLATTSQFQGPKANTGTAMFFKEGGKNMLKVSDDFKVPDTPDPHWQVVDSKGNTYLLQRLNAKNLGGLAKDRLNASITLPAYIKDVKKVQFWCSFAEVLLGEAEFEEAQK